MSWQEMNEKWWDKKSKNNDPQQSYYEEQKQMAEIQKNHAKLSVPYDTSKVAGLYNSDQALVNQAYLNAQQQKNTAWSMANANFNGYSYSGNWAKDYSPEIEKAAKPIIDFMNIVVQLL